MSRADASFAKRALMLAAVFCGGISLVGCQSIREATGVAKLPPDEFTVLTKAPLVLPPDYNLRPPQPGIASRNELNAEEQARAALFASQQDQVQALGNVIDRMLYGAVVDFFHFHAFGRDWYVFNVADAAITVGVVVLVLDAFVRPEERKDSERVIRK